MAKQSMQYEHFCAMIRNAISKMSAHLMFDSGNGKFCRQKLVSYEMNKQGPFWESVPDMWMRRPQN